MTGVEKVGPAELERELIRLLSGRTHWGLPGHPRTISGRRVMNTPTALN